MVHKITLRDRYSGTMSTTLGGQQANGIFPFCPYLIPFGDQTKDGRQQSLNSISTILATLGVLTMSLQVLRRSWAVNYSETPGQT